MDAQEHHLDLSAGERLAYWTLGVDDGRPLVILLHGMRDVGRSLLPIAEPLAEHCHCVLPDLRGHGNSLRPGSYAIQHFLMDLRRLVKHLHKDSEQPFGLLGHSLGGHIACRYAGLFPEELGGLVIVDGLGPPTWEMTKVDELEQVASRIDSAISTAHRAESPRVLPSVNAAAERLIANNPRLDPDWAQQLARWGTSEVEDGVIWSFDPRAHEVFLGLSQERNFDFWRRIVAPALVVIGDLAHEYWKSGRDIPGYSGRFSEPELRERLDCFASVEYHEVRDAGHQVHYDQPQELARVTHAFFERTLGLRSHQSDPLL